MQPDYILCHFGELHLKGKNKIHFEHRLISNITDCFKKNNISYEKITRSFARLIIKTNDKKAIRYLPYIFGLSYIFPSVKTIATLEEIAKVSLKLSSKIKPTNTFKINTIRANKSHPSSLEINTKIGKMIAEHTKAKVKLDNPDCSINIQLLDSAYISIEKIPCLNGLPLGIEGRVFALIEDKNSLLAAFLMMKRGCSLIPVSFKDINLDLLKKYAYGFDLKLIRIKNIEEIESLSKKYGIDCLVSTQTLENFKDLNLNLTVLRPLIVYSQKEIDEKIDFIEKF